MTVLLERPVDSPRRARGSGWRPALRIARRELLRAPARTLVVLLMVLLPVTGVVALDTLLRTAEISAAESLPAELGTAEARLDLSDGGPVRQSPDGRQAEVGEGSGRGPDERDLRAVLPVGSRLLTVRDSAGSEQGFRTAQGRVVRAVLVGADLRDDAVRGPFALLSGRVPATPDEVAVTAELARLGLPPGTALALPDGRPGRVTGTVALPPSSGTPRTVVGLPAAVGLQDARVSRVFVSGAELSWDDVLELNGLGVSVLSRAVLRDPPPDELVPDLPSYEQQAATTAALIGLIVVMAVLEVVLLAGPAFAVGARRSRRALALLAATGGEPRHVRRVVLAQGVLVGGTAALLGSVLGVGLAAAARGPLTRWTGAPWGPFEVSLRDVVLLALLGAGTAVLAAVLPARLAAREPVVASLRGRRPRPTRTALPTTVGLVLFCVGVLMCLASLRQSSSELLIALSALPTVLGAVLLAPVLLHVLGRSAARLPLPLRYAARDADRQRTRTAPAVAAVAATVAAAVALGTAGASDARQQRASWSPSTPPGSAVVSGRTGGTPIDWPAVERAARSALPGEDVLTVRGLSLDVDGAGGSDEDVQLCRPDAARAVFCDDLRTDYGGGLGASVLVGQEALDAVAPLLGQGSLPVARRALAEGAVVAFGASPPTLDVRRQRVLHSSDGGEPTTRLVAEVTAPVVSVPVPGTTAPALAVLGDDLAERLGGSTTTSLVVGDHLTRAQEERLRDEVSLVDTGVLTSVQRGPDEGRGAVALLLLVLAAGGLVLAGTFAATSLALVEAQPDFAVLGQVGARPRARRTVAGAYAAVLALAGGVLGVLAGLVPGVTAALALTDESGASRPPGGPPPSAWAHVTVPWPLLAAVLVLLPVLAGALAATTARSTPRSAAVRRTA